MLHSPELARLSIPTVRPVEGSFTTEIDVIDGLWDSNGPRRETIWVSFEGTINRDGELRSLTTYIDGVECKKHSEPDWLYQMINDHVGAME